MKKIRFPEDELAHDSIIEWWYFNGHLADNKNNKYAFMSCLFKVKTKEVKIPFISNIPKKTIYFSHSIVSDIKNQKYYPVINYFSIISRDSWKRPLLFVNYTNPITVKGYLNSVIEQIEANKYRVKEEIFDLNLISTKKPLLEGGEGFLKVGETKSTYYYSLTNLKTQGMIKIDNEWIRVTGKSWMDHQWADVKYTKDEWTWFSIQLDNNTEIMCFEYRENKTKTYLASILYPDNTQKHLTKMQVTPLGDSWKSSKTKNNYQISWQIKIPEEKINLKVKPLIRGQEMIFGVINYWEGPISVAGICNNKRVEGQGFLELIGRPTQYPNIKLIKKEILDKIKNVR